ncbi:MAG TPA: TrkA family potassium uptake protein [Armatimonadaceae bacterium]|jgi:trk system potassium uptake protein TrkA|nr:TrkA family potassium uptake protein [Armatimonadaceae bacterium]
MYCIIVGGGNVGYYLSKDLATAGHEVLLLEKDRQRASRLVEELGEMAMQGDGCEVRVMEEVGFGRADVIVAVTGEDEDNLVVCQMAKRKFGVPRTIARVNSPANEALFNKLGIDTTVSATRIIFNLLEQEIESDLVVPLAALSRGNLEIVQVELSPQSRVVGKRIAEVVMPAGAHIVSVIRQDRGMLPAPEAVLETGDSVLALVSTELENELVSTFGEV